VREPRWRRRGGRAAGGAAGGVAEGAADGAAGGAAGGSAGGGAAGRRQGDPRGVAGVIRRERLGNDGQRAPEPDMGTGQVAASPLSGVTRDPENAV